MRGIPLQLSSRVKKEKHQKVHDLLNIVKTLENSQKATPSQSIHNDLFKARLELRKQLMGEYEQQIKRFRFTHYHSINKPSKQMARRLAAAREKNRIPYLLSSRHQQKIVNPSEMAN